MKRVLFLCKHNENRSQMAEAFFNKMACANDSDARARSAGTEPGTEIDPNVRAVMNEIGYPLENQFPKPLSQTLVNAADRILSMGCGVDTSNLGFRVRVDDDWSLDDPKDLPIERIRDIRDQIRRKVEALLQELTIEPLFEERTRR